jgi:hypothetical protein
MMDARRGVRPRRAVLSGQRAINRGTINRNNFDRTETKRGRRSFHGQGATWLPGATESAAVCNSEDDPQCHPV